MKTTMKKLVFAALASLACAAVPSSSAAAVGDPCTLGICIDPSLEAGACGIVLGEVKMDEKSRSISVQMCKCASSQLTAVSTSASAAGTGADRWRLTDFTLSH